MLDAPVVQLVCALFRQDVGMFVEALLLALPACGTWQHMTTLALRHMPSLWLQNPILASAPDNHDEATGFNTGAQPVIPTGNQRAFIMTPAGPMPAPVSATLADADAVRDSDHQPWQVRPSCMGENAVWQLSWGVKASL